MTQPPDDGTALPKDPNASDAEGTPEAPSPTQSTTPDQSATTPIPSDPTEPLAAPAPGPYATMPSGPPPLPAEFQQQAPAFPVTSSKTNGLSIAALITGIVGLGIVPIVLGAIGLGQARKRGEQGRGFAIAGIVLGALAIVGWAILAGVLAAAMNAANTDDIADSDSSYSDSYATDSPGADALDEQETDETAPPAVEYTAGTCFATAPLFLDTAPVVPCTDPHDAEIVAVVDLTGIATADNVTDIAEQKCGEAFNAIPALTERTDLSFQYFSPNAIGWETGDHTAYCMVSTEDVTARLTGSFVG